MPDVFLPCLNKDDDDDDEAYYLMYLLREVLIYHNGYHIPKLWAYVNHGIF